MADDELGQVVRRLWTRGAEAHEERLDAGCIMAFPPEGIMIRDLILQLIAEARRWTAGEMSDRQISAPAENIAVLACRARARRAGGAYEAVRASVYVLRDGRWLMVQYQQALL